ncbi:MAG TPA: glycosyltransferase family 4 protein [Pyrinomonadaceae bacterium]|jgi:glycosyltransferase involved in cell wall biosynthesis|nr:glycosyltransferase family 4 protein [Pyrinomonadaceae bacterium]
MRVFVLTDSPSPYQVEFFNEIETRRRCELQVGYLRRRDPERHWNAQTIRHDAIELENANGVLQHAREAMRTADLVVFNYYRQGQAEELIQQRAAHGGPWCFWGERPGLRQPAWAGRLLRKWKLSKLHESAVPIWGIGEFAVNGYRREFGIGRSYFNLPYFSDLERFKPRITRKKSEVKEFLFSGSLMERKGVDLLARAFVRLAREAPNVRLKIMGEGNLREAIERILRPVRERVEFVGFKDWSALPELYASADVLCVPSRYDGWGLVVPEGLASGLPVIATDRMGAGLEFIRTGENGWLIPAADEDAILGAMREAVSLSDLELDQMGQRAQESVSEHTLAHGVERFVRYGQKSVDV